MNSVVTLVGVLAIEALLLRTHVPWVVRSFKGKKKKSQYTVESDVNETCK